MVKLINYSTFDLSITNKQTIMKRPENKFVAYMTANNTYNVTLKSAFEKYCEPNGCKIIVTGSQDYCMKAIKYL